MKKGKCALQYTCWKFCCVFVLMWLLILKTLHLLCKNLIVTELELRAGPYHMKGRAERERERARETKERESRKADKRKKASMGGRV